MFCAGDSADAHGVYRGSLDGLAPDKQDEIDRDLVLLGGEFLNKLLPKNKQYLYHYFRTDLERQFVTYYLLFKSHTHFVSHTGYECTYRWRKKLRRRLKRIEKAHDDAVATGDFEKVAIIQMGDFDGASKNMGC
jgi:hypothetical protein